eukprot:symbB.v1.2.036916.t1/scaffold5324.1/size28421/3
MPLRMPTVALRQRRHGKTWGIRSASLMIWCLMSSSSVWTYLYVLPDGSASSPAPSALRVHRRSLALLGSFLPLSAEAEVVKGAERQVLLKNGLSFPKASFGLQLGHYRGHPSKKSGKSMMTRQQNASPYKPSRLVIEISSPRCWLEISAALHEQCKNQGCHERSSSFVARS